MSTLLADLVVAMHLAYLSFVVLGQVAIVVGWLRGWRWVRNPWFRWLHLAAIVIVVLEEAWHIECPLTTLEAYLREEAGEPASFVGRCLDRIVFVPWLEGYFAVVYVGFALLVLGTLWVAPPRGFRQRKKADLCEVGPK